MAPAQSCDLVNYRYGGGLIFSQTHIRAHIGELRTTSTTRLKISKLSDMTLNCRKHCQVTKKANNLLRITITKQKRHNGPENPSTFGIG